MQKLTKPHGTTVVLAERPLRFESSVGTVRLLASYRARYGEPEIATDTKVEKTLEVAIASGDLQKLSTHFQWSERKEIVEAWQADSGNSYRDVQRLGRKSRLGEKQRQQLWEVFELIRERLADRGLLTRSVQYREAFAVRCLHSGSRLFKRQRCGPCLRILGRSCRVVATPSLFSTTVTILVENKAT